MALLRPQACCVWIYKKVVLARYKHLPLYQSCYSLCLHVYRLRSKFPRTIKHDLGSLFFESTVRCLRGVVVANGHENKQRQLSLLALEFETLWIYSRLLYDLRVISEGEFRVLSGMLAGVGAQIQAWMKWEKAQKKEKEKMLAKKSP